MTDTVLVTVDGSIGRITLNAPDRLNALDADMLDAVTAAIRELGERAEVRVIALAGTGRGFCAGANLGDGPVDSGSGPSGDDGLDATLVAAGHAIRAIRDCPTPVVALVHGVAAGVGVSLALVTDYVLASEAASFVLAFARIGLMPDGGATALVAAHIGRARALRMALTGEKVDGRTAGEWGLVAEVVAAQDFSARGEALLAQLAASAPRAAYATRRAINEASVDLDAAIALEERDQSELLRSADFVEGVTAFREKRPATFTGC